MGRCSTVLQLAAKWPADRNRGSGHDGDGGVHAQRRYSPTCWITRNTGATYFIPSENEWYKAAYYKGGSTNAGYWAYPTKSDANNPPSNMLSATGTNNANFYDVYGTGNGGYTDPTNFLTPVGAFAASPGPYGTYDMGGDVWQWNELTVGGSRGLRGAFWLDSSDRLAASSREVGTPWGCYYGGGFRVASVPEPGAVTLLLAGAISLCAYAWRRRGRTA